MLLCLACVCALSVAAWGGPDKLESVAGPAPAELLTVAERSGYRATSRHQDVVVLLDRIAAASPWARRAEMGVTTEGRSIPMLIVSDPPVQTGAAAVARARDDGRLVVLLFGNIHAGEVDGKEALMMLARELAGAERSPLLDKLIVVIAPIYNADGNERMGKDNRPGQVGPDEMGIRENAAGLDLNRDFVKLEAPETRALVAFLIEWDPAIVVDTHTTNGSYHRYLLTYDGPKAPAGDARLIEYVRDGMLPRVGARFKEMTGRDSFVYGNFEGEFDRGGVRGHTRWESFPAEARYGTTYIGLRGRISILTESYSYATYKERVLGTLAFCRAVLEEAAARADEVRAMLSEVDRGHAGAEVAIRSRMAAAPGRVTIPGFEEEARGGRSVSTGVARDYEAELWNRFEPVRTVAMPRAYALTVEAPAVALNLTRHGIESYALAIDTEVEVESYVITSVKKASRLFQGHSLNLAEAEMTRLRKTLPKGTLIVPGDQKLGRLAAYLLEPECEDGLLTWNFFDPWLQGGEFPVVRVVDGHELPRAGAQDGAGAR